MLTTELQRSFKPRLEQTKHELETALRDLTDIAIQPRADMTDEVQQDAERDLAIQKHDRQSNQLREVIQALQRIDLGLFGHCLRCEEEINSNRLAAIPWAKYCLKCQTLEDQKITKEVSERHYFSRAKTGEAVA